MTKKQKKMVEDHKERMYHMRVFGLDWQGIHKNVGVKIVYVGKINVIVRK